MKGRPAPRATHPLLSSGEILALGLLFLFTLWIVGPKVETSAVALTMYWLAVAIWAGTMLWLAPVLHKDPPALRGWGGGRAADDPGRVSNAWPSYLGLTVAVGAFMLIVTAVRDPAFAAHVDWRRFGLKLAGYLVYGPVQALVFFGYLQTRLRRILSCWLAEGPALRAILALCVAALFGAAHAPNWLLACMVTGVGLAWSWLFYARPSVLLLGASHAVLGTIVFAVMGVYTRIGPFYAHPEGHIIRHAIPGLSALIGDVY
jgi:hypothetical protein